MSRKSNIIRITLYSHAYFAMPVVVLFAAMQIVVLVSARIKGVRTDQPMMLFWISEGLAAIPGFFLIVLHLQYWRRNRKTGVEFGRDELRIYKNGAFVESVKLNDNVDVERVVGNAHCLPNRYFFYCIWRYEEDTNPIILTSLLVGNRMQLNRIGYVRESLVPYIDV